ncbi:hypothetical protein HK100_010393, partial [Physocladia obscura]
MGVLYSLLLSALIVGLATGIAIAHAAWVERRRIEKAKEDERRRGPRRRIISDSLSPVLSNSDFNQHLYRKAQQQPQQQHQQQQFYVNSKAASNFTHDDRRGFNQQDSFRSSFSSNQLFNAQAQQHQPIENFNSHRQFQNRAQQETRFQPPAQQKISDRQFQLQKQISPSQSSLTNLAFIGNNGNNNSNNNNGLLHRHRTLDTESKGNYEKFQSIAASSKKLIPQLASKNEEIDDEVMVQSEDAEEGGDEDAEEGNEDVEEEIEDEVAQKDQNIRKLNIPVAETAAASPFSVGKRRRDEEQIPGTPKEKVISDRLQKIRRSVEGSSNPATPIHKPTTRKSDQFKSAAALTTGNKRKSTHTTVEHMKESIKSQLISAVDEDVEKDMREEDGWITPARYRQKKRRRDIEGSSVSVVADEHDYGNEGKEDKVGPPVLPVNPSPRLAPASTKRGRVKMSSVTPLKESQRREHQLHITKAPTPLLRKPLSDEAVRILVSAKLDGIASSEGTPFRKVKFADEAGLSLEAGPSPSPFGKFDNKNIASGTVEEFGKPGASDRLFGAPIYSSKPEEKKRDAVLSLSDLTSSAKQPESKSFETSGSSLFANLASPPKLKDNISFSGFDSLGAVSEDKSKGVVSEQTLGSFAAPVSLPATNEFVTTTEKTGSTAISFGNGGNLTSSDATTGGLNFGNVSNTENKTDVPAVSSVSFGSSVSGDKLSAPSVKPLVFAGFGSSTATEAVKPAISFGTTPSLTTTTEAPKPLPSEFGFSIPSISNKDTLPTTTDTPANGFTLAAATSLASSGETQKSTFSFGTPVSGTALAFGTSTVNPSGEKKSESSSSFSFGNPATSTLPTTAVPTTTPSGPGFNGFSGSSATSGVPATQTPASSSGFTFGSSTPSTAPIASTPSFGAPSSSTALSSFNFGVTQTTATAAPAAAATPAPSGFNFGTPASTANVPSSFGFGNATKSSQQSGASFGVTPSGAGAPAFGVSAPSFGSSQSISTTSSTPSFAFGTAASNATPTPTFGSTNSTSTTPAFSTFGSSGTTAAVTPFGNMNGSSSTPAVANSSSSSTPAFNSTAAPTAFGGASAQVFGAANPNSSFGTSASAPGFGQNPTNGSTFTFGSSTGGQLQQQQNSGSGGFNFGGGNSSPAFGAPAAPGTSFQFGVAGNGSTFGQQNGSSSGFGFGQPQQPQASTSSFAFGSSQLGGQTPAQFAFGGGNQPSNSSNTSNLFTMGAT